MIDKDFIEETVVDKEGVAKLSHALWKQKSLYSRAYELSEKTLLNKEYLPLLVEVLEDIKQVNEKFVEERLEMIAHEKQTKE